MKTWKISGLIILISWLIIATIIWFRNIDGAGVTQTPRLKEITLIIWVICAVPILIGYIIWGFILKRKTRN